MATEIITRTKCDRCNRVIGNAKAYEDTPDDMPVFCVEERGKEIICFTDLCSKCLIRVEALTKQLRLDNDKVEKDEPANDVDRPADVDEPAEEHSEE